MHQEINKSTHKERFISVAHLGYGRHGSCHGCYFKRDARIARQKL